MQDEIFNVKEAQQKEILELGMALYCKVKNDAAAIVEKNKQLQKENCRLSVENDVLGKRINAIDDNANVRLRSQKNAEIDRLEEDLRKAESEAVHSGNIAYSIINEPIKQKVKSRKCLMSQKSDKFGTTSSRTRKTSRGSLAMDK